MDSDFFQSENDKRRNDPDNYLWGIFYFNREDSRVILPKRNRSMGWTLNFANPFTYIIILTFILVAILLGRLEN